jgi:acetoacetyl-CoA synthetase
MTEAPLWNPGPDRIESTNLFRFARRAAPQFATTGQLDYAGLHSWSIADPGRFWHSFWDFAEVSGSPGESVFEDRRDILADRYFPSARLNLATNLLARTGDSDAIITYDEVHGRRSISWDALRRETGACAAALRADGVGRGDRVVLYLPNGIEAIIAMIAAASLGATISSCSPDFGADGALDRFGQISPKVLVATRAYAYGGSNFDVSAKVTAISHGLTTLVRTVLIENDWESWLAPHRGSPVPADDFAADQPWYVLYSSGTTGKPKCFVHRAGGVLLQHRKEQMLHCDISAGDVVLFFTTTGWMMWNWLASVLASGATIVCIDGNPAHPTANHLFDVVDREAVTLLGVGAKFVDSLRKSGLRPRDTHDLSSLRTFCATGSPLNDDGFRYVYDAIRPEVHLASISGGTDLCGCFVMGDPTGPVFAGEIQRPALAMAVDVFDENGRSLKAEPGTRGELVCTQSFPSMPLGFWGDDDGSRLHSAYFEHFAGVWAHGDFASWTEHGGMKIHGRSDTTLNPAGVRIGTAEIYAQVEAVPEIAEALVFGQDWDDDSRIVLLVRMMPEQKLTEERIADVKRRIRANCSPRHVPAIVVEVADFPRTRSGKLAELAISDSVNGRPIRNAQALANPEAIDAIVALPQLGGPKR